VKLRISTRFSKDTCLNCQKSVALEQQSILVTHDVFMKNFLQGAIVSAVVFEVSGIR